MTILSATRLSRLFLLAIAFISVNTSCKKPQPPAKETEVPAENCHLDKFTEFERTYSFEYDANGLPVKLFRIVGGFDPVLYRRFEYAAGKLTVMHAVTLEGFSFPATTYEYNGDRLTTIEMFDGRSRDVLDPNIEVKLAERIEFGYGSNANPASLTRLFPDDNGVLYKSHHSEFEYDAAGNLTVEKRHAFARPNVNEADYVFEYFYDDKPNTQKQLNHLFFSATDFPASGFSRNNMNRIRLSHDGNLIRDQLLKVAYTPEGNVITDGYRYSGMTWTCK